MMNAKASIGALAEYGRIQLFGMYGAQPQKYPAQSATAFYAALAVTQSDEESPGTRAAIDSSTWQQGKRNPRND